MTTSTDAEFQGGYTDQVSKTLPRNYNNSTSTMTNAPAATPPTQTPATAAAAAALPPPPPTPIPVPVQPVQGLATGRQVGVLEYFDLDHSNPPPICNNSNTSASTSNLSTPTTGVSGWSNNLANRLSTVSISSSSVFGNQNTTDANIGANPLSITPSSGAISNAPVASGVVYKSVDFIKTEAFMRTRQDAEMARAKNRSK